jgi:glycine/D-amino acid oxidase-like deaminating enzyme
MTSDRALDVIIAGGGIVGAATAAACARAGLQVALVERDIIGGGATAAAMGHIVIMDDSEAQFALTRYSQKLWQRLKVELPAAAEYQQRGTLWIACNDDEMAEAERKHRFYRERGVPSRLLSSQQVAELEPNLRTGLAGGLLVSEDAVVDPSVVALHLAHAAQASGATLIMGHSVVTMGGGAVVLDDGSRLTAPRLVNATGAWSPEITPALPVKKRKGHLVITDPYPGFVRHQVVELGYLRSAHAINSDSVAFNVQPRQSGQILIGSSRQYGDESPEVSQRVLTAMLEHAATFMPGLSSLNLVRTWTGLRAATTDKLPLIGPSPLDPSLWLATGHEGLGITTSLGTAELLAAAFLARQPEIPAEPYLPARFQQAPLGHPAELMSSAESANTPLSR